MISSAAIRRNIQKLLPFGLIWLFSGWVFHLIERVAMGDIRQGGPTIQIDFELVIFSSLALTIVGLLIGAIELFFLNHHFTNRSFLQKILFKTLFYFVLLVLIISITYPLASSLELDLPLFDSHIWERYYAYFFSPANLSTMVQLDASLVLSLIYAEISETMGHRFLLNFFTGKYHRPRTEKRIFMFLDMKDSTKIAESLGHERYFQLLKSYYRDLSQSIIDHEGEIYQYVGDEVVVSWTYQRGLRKRNCLACFHSISKAIESKRRDYEEQFGLLPEFKAGMHLGEVCTGEIGALKKELVSTGDVLNSTARIQGLCNQYKVKLLLSRALVDTLDLQENEFQSIGHIHLRGRKEEMEICGVFELK